MWIHERTHARILALTRCSTTRIRVEPRTHMRTHARARVYSRSFARSPVCWCMCTHRTAANTHTYVHICMHAYRYMTRATDTCKRSSPLSLSLSLSRIYIHTHMHTHILPLFLSHSFSLSPPPSPAFFLFRSYPCAFSPSILLLFPTSRPPPSSAPSRIFYSFSLLFASLSSSMPSSRSTPFPPSLSPPNFFLCL